jgi:hypothetical protein
MDDYLLFDRDFSVLDEVCVNSADPEFKTALMTGEPEALRAWCRRNPRKLHRSFDWLTDSPKNKKTKELIEREIGRRGRLQAAFIAVILAIASFGATQVFRSCFQQPESGRGVSEPPKTESRRQPSAPRAARPEESP